MGLGVELPSLSGIGEGIVENLGEIVETGLSKSIRFILPTLVIPALIKELYRYAATAPIVENDNLIDPNYSIVILKAFTAAVGLLDAAEAGEVLEILTEGVGEALSDAIRHVVTEPFEKVFSLYRGNREIDEDEIADGYSYGAVAPEVLGMLAGYDGYSSLSMLMLVSKSAGMYYSSNMKTVESTYNALSARAMDVRLDPYELALSMERSVVNGIDEATRTEADRILSELRQIAGRAYDRLRDAYHALYIASMLFDTNRQDADAFALQAKALGQDAEAYIAVFDKFESDIAGPVLDSLPDRIVDIISEAVEDYWAALRGYLLAIGLLLEPVSKYIADATVAFYEEINRALSVLKDYRLFVPQVDVPEPDYNVGTLGPHSRVIVSIGEVK